MKLLSVSGFHGTLEYDNLKLFDELGIEWFSAGLYFNPKAPLLDHAPRKPLNKDIDPTLIQEFLKLNPGFKIYQPINISKEFADKFDIVLIDHCCPLQLSTLQNNWENIKHKPVIWRTYSQQTARLEYLTQYYRNLGLKIVRNSPCERTIPFYAGDDAIIRGYVDPEEYYGWTGSNKMVLTFNNLFDKRKLHSNTDLYIKIRNRFEKTPFELYGCDNENVSLSLGRLSWEQQKEKYREARVYFALGSKPASSTYNLLEAMMTGCPVITWGPELGNLKMIADWANTYEVPKFIKNGYNGFCFDNEQDIIFTINELMNNDELAKQISANARKTAIELFSKEVVKANWISFFSSLGFTL